MFRGVIACLILLSLLTIILGADLSVYSNFDILEGSFGLSLELSVDIWRYHALLTFSPKFASKNGSIFLIGSLADPSDVFQEVWFTSERLDVTYSEIPNPKIFDFDVFMAGGKSLNIVLMDVFGLSAYYGGTSVSVRSNGWFSGFSYISANDAGISTLSGLRIGDTVLGWEDNSIFLGFLDDAVFFGVPLNDLRRSWLMLRSRRAFVAFRMEDFPSFRIVETVTPFNLSVTVKSPDWQLSSTVEFGNFKVGISSVGAHLERLNLAFEIF